MQEDTSWYLVHSCPELAGQAGCGTSVQADNVKANKVQSKNQILLGIYMTQIAESIVTIVMLAMSGVLPAAVVGAVVGGPSPEA